MAYSQFGSEKVLAEIFATIGVKFRCCCEFGAGDGMLFSNTAALVREQGWDGRFIESDADLFASLAQHYADVPNARYENWAVTTENVNTLVRPPLDFLSIDVDGQDYWIFKALECRPRVVMIEYNPHRSGPESIMDQDPFYHRQVNDYAYGASKEAMAALAETKGYNVVHDDGKCNLFLVEKELWHGV